MPTSACTSPGKVEGGTGKPPPPKKKIEGGEPPPNHERAPAGKKKKKRKGARDSHTTAKPHTHSTRGGQPPQPGNTKGDTHGAPRKNTGGPPCPTRQHPAESSSPPRPHDRRRAGGKDTPDTPAHTPPEKWRATGHTEKKKKQTQPKRKGKGGRRPRGPRPGQAAANTTKPRHDRAENHTPPPRSQKKKEGGGGEKPYPRQPPHNPTPQAAPPGGGGKRTGRTQEATRPNTQTRKSKVQEKPKPTHTHHEPQPGMAERSQNPYPSTHTLDPSQEWRGYRRTQPQTRAPRTPARNGGAKPKPEPKHTHPRPRRGMAESPRNPDPNTNTTRQ